MSVLAVLGVHHQFARLLQSLLDVFLGGFAAEHFRSDFRLLDEQGGV